MADEALVQQIAREAEELRNVPKVAITTFMSPHARRCHICGRLVSESGLAPFDDHIPGAQVRMACTWCHPNRGA